MKKTLVSVVVAIALAPVVASSPAQAAGLAAQDAQQAKDTKTVAGRWTMSVDSPHGAITMDLVLKQDGKKITGTFVSPHGEFPIEGEFADRTLKLAARPHGGDSADMTLNAKLKDDGALAGYLSTSTGDMMWTAQRVKE